MEKMTVVTMLVGYQKLDLEVEGAIGNVVAVDRVDALMVEKRHQPLRAPEMEETVTTKALSISSKITSTAI